MPSLLSRESRSNWAVCFYFFSKEEPPKPLKKLCISKKPAPQKTIDVADVLKSGSSSDVIMMLIQLSEALPTQVLIITYSYRLTKTKTQTNECFGPVNYETHWY